MFVHSLWCIYVFVLNLRFFDSEIDEDNTLAYTTTISEERFTFFPRKYKQKHGGTNLQNCCYEDSDYEDCDGSTE